MIVDVVSESFQCLESSENLSYGIYNLNYPPSGMALQKLNIIITGYREGLISVSLTQHIVFLFRTCCYLMFFISCIVIIKK